jgi:membrane fusion protein, multidrug efflux system
MVNLMIRFLLLLALVLAAIGCDRSPATKEEKRRKTSVPVTVAPAKSVRWEKRLLLVGTLLPAQEARLAAEVEGRIEKTYVEVGDRVKAGQDLAQIDMASYQGMVNLHTANLNKAEVRAVNETTNLERLEKLRASGAVSSTAYDEAVALQQAAKAEVAAAKAQLGAASTSLKRSALKAPFDGSISARLVTEGDFARVGTVMFHIVDDSVLRFRGEIPERDAERVKAGQTVRVRVDAWPGKTFDGKITWVNPAVNPETRSVGIEARVENAGRALKAHLFARGEIVTDSAADTLVVSADAVVSFVGVDKVYVVAGEKAEPREVQLGERRGEEQSVLSGLKEGDPVIVGGASKVQPGSAVSVREK